MFLVVERLLNTNCHTITMLIYNVMLIQQNYVMINNEIKDHSIIIVCVHVLNQSVTWRHKINVQCIIIMNNRMRMIARVEGKNDIRTII